MKEFLFFCNGDANDANVWSNVPYCFSHALENKGFTVHRVDYSMSPSFVKFYDLFLRRVLDAFTIRKLRFPYLRTTRLFKYFAERKIKKAIKNNPNADLCIFMGYGFTNKWNCIPTLLFSDWTTEMDVLKKRSPNFLEQRMIRQESEAIQQAEYVVSMFPVCCEEMKKKYPEANIHYLGGNVINDLSGIHDLKADKVVSQKERSNHILFIGRKSTYYEAAKKLVEAFRILKQEEDFKDYVLDIVGCSAADFEDFPDGVICYGFLNKSHEEHRKSYYKLLTNAKLLVNANPHWGAYSSTVEAMYFYTPVIISPYKDFVADFGNDISFGLYNEEFSAECMAMNIKNLLDSTGYCDICRAAHEAVKDYTWDHYVDKILELLR